MVHSDTPIIDVHSHIVPPAYWSAITDRVDEDAAFASLAHRNNLVPQPADGPMRTLDERLEEMDAAGVDISVLSLPPPGAAIRAGDAGMAREINDELIAMAESEPKRLRVLCVLPLPDVKQSLRELERVSGHELVRGVGVTTNVADWHLDDPELDPIYQRMSKQDLPLFTHPALEPQPAGYDDFALTASLSAVVSSSLGVLRLVYSGTLDRAPGLTVIMPHLGGVIPYLLQRLLDLGGQQQAAFPLDRYLHERLILDTCSYHPPAFRCAVETTGAGRLVLGTDYPFRGTLHRAVQDVRSQALSPNDEAAVLGGTAARWFS